MTWVSMVGSQQAEAKLKILPSLKERREGKTKAEKEREMMGREETRKLMSEIRTWSPHSV